MSGYYIHLLYATNQYQLVLTNYQLIVCISPDITAVHLQLAVLAPHSLNVYPF